MPSEDCFPNPILHFIIHFYQFYETKKNRPILKWNGLLYFLTIRLLHNKIFPMEKITMPTPIDIYYHIHAANIYKYY